MDKPVSPVDFAVLRTRVETLETNYVDIRISMARIEEKLGKVLLIVAVLAGGTGAGVSAIAKAFFGAG